MQNGLWRVAVVLVCGLVAAEAGAQAFNIDTGPKSVSPSSAYGGAASQPGFWNPAYSLLGTSLSDVNGQPTTAFFSGTWAASTLYNIQNASPDEAALMNSALLLGGAATSVVVNGLTAGWYDVYMYCSGGSVESTLRISSSGKTVARVVANNAGWPGHQVEGVTYAKVTLEVTAGFDSIGVIYNLPSDNLGPLNGIQLVPVPTPNTALPLLVGVGAICRRRR